MATLPIKPLEGADGYLRWKESVLLHLHSVDVAHVLSDDPPAPASDGDAAAAAAAAAKKWARDDALCRGHILAALSDHLLPVYVRHATGRVLWQAVARTYEQDASSWALKFEQLEFGEEETLLERVARAEALAIAGSGRYPRAAPDDNTLAWMVGEKLPDVAHLAVLEGEDTGMDGIWRSAQGMVQVDNYAEILAARHEKEDTISSSSKSGYIAKKRRW